MGSLQPSDENSKKYYDTYDSPYNEWATIKFFYGMQAHEGRGFVHSKREPSGKYSNRFLRRTYDQREPFPSLDSAAHLDVIV
jgi:hypothetical protein